MTPKPVLDRYGQEVAPHQLTAMALGIASGIGNGVPAGWSGFSWYRPQGLFQQNLIHRSKRSSRAQAA